MKRKKTLYVFKKIFVNFKRKFKNTYWFFFLEKMVNLTYNRTPFDLESSLVQLLKQIWTYDTHSDKHECVDCLMFEEWCISYARTKWEPDFVDFDLVIRKIKETDRTFINFDRISIFEPEKAYHIFRNNNSF